MGKPRLAVVLPAVEDAPDPPDLNVLEGGADRGIAQWSFDGRLKTLERVAAQQHASRYPLGFQMEFVWWELTNRSSGYAQVLRAFKATQGHRHSNQLILTRYEQPALDAAYLDWRQYEASWVLSQFWRGR
jgi:hypothetical protein